MTDDQETGTSRDKGRWDPLALELQRLRTAAGEPSYATVTQLVVDRRVAAGETPEAARLARSTVYDCFRTGRVRVNVALVREIAAVLGAEDDQVDRWLLRCRPDAADETVPAQRSGTDPEPPEPEPIEPPAPPRPRLVALVLVACVAANLLGPLFQGPLRLPIYLDMTGTAVAAIVLGPWWGALVGLTTNVGAGVLVGSPSYFPFALVNIAGALVWGYGVRRLRLGRTLPRFFGLNVLAAVVCSAVAVPILLLLFSGSTGHAQDTVRATFTDLTGSHTVAVAGANLVVSLGDKVLTGFVALVTVAALPCALRCRVPLEVLPDHGAARTP